MKGKLSQFGICLKISAEAGPKFAFGTQHPRQQKRALAEP